MSYVSTSRGNLLMESLDTFFKKKENLNKILHIIQGDSKISLRVIDWFVTNYSKKYNTSYIINNLTQAILNDSDTYIPNNCRTFIVYIDYKLQLKGYSKRQFDPFCRRSRINFYYNEKDFFVTTIGQLNFFRWIINNNILDYVQKHYETIDFDMNTCYKQQYNANKSSNIKRRKRQELSISASKSLSKSHVKVVLSFD